METGGQIIALSLPLCALEHQYIPKGSFSTACCQGFEAATRGPVYRPGFWWPAGLMLAAPQGCTQGLSGKSPVIVNTTRMVCMTSM